MEEEEERRWGKERIGKRGRKGMREIIYEFTQIVERRWRRKRKEKWIRDGEK